MAPPAVPGQRLADREREALEWVSRGYSNGLVARKMGLSEDTVKTHLRRVFIKLRARDRAHAVRIGFENGILQPEATITTPKAVKK